MSSFAVRVRALRDKGNWFAAARSIYVTRSPGRLDLMGGNDDYTGGMVFESTIREATWAAAQARDDRQLVLVNPQMSDHGWQAAFECSLDDLADVEQLKRLVNRDPGVRWTAYVLGVLYWLQKFRGPLPGGLTVLIESDVPLNKGVSSSAAVEVAVMKAAAAACGIDLRGVALAEACQWAENVIAESACGIMDQIAVVLGEEGFVLPLVCQPCRPLPLVQLPPGLTCWGVDSGVRHQVSGVEYEAARAAAFMGYKLICDREGLLVERDEHAAIPRFTDSRWNGYLANLVPSQFRAFECELPETVTGAEYLAAGQPHVDPFTAMRPKVAYRVRACTRYAVEENHRVQLFAELARGMAGGLTIPGATLMGELMYQSHLAYTDTGLGCAQTDLLVELARGQGVERGIFGAKITGGGGGGTVAVLGRADAESAFDEIVEGYRQVTGIDAYVFRGSSPGADRFGVEVLESGA